MAIDMKIEQYRNLFENWQRHLVEGKVEDTSSLPPLEHAVTNLVKAQAEEHPTQELFAVNLDIAQDVAQEEDSDDISRENQEVLNWLVTPIQAAPESQSAEESFSDDARLNTEGRKALYKIIMEALQESEKSDADRGGTEAQVATRNVLNGILPEGLVAISNIAGSGIPDVVVVNNNVDKVSVAADTPMNANLWNKLVQIPGAVVAEFEVKSSTVKGDTAPDAQVTNQVAFFDQTLGEGHEDEKYFTPFLKSKVEQMKDKFEFRDGKNKSLTYDEMLSALKENAPERKDKEAWATGKLLDMMLTQAYVIEDNVKCGNYGELTAPPEGTSDYYDLSNWKEQNKSGKFTKKTERPVNMGQKHFGARKSFKGVYSALPAEYFELDGQMIVTFVADSKHIGGKGKPITPQRGGWKLHLLVGGAYKFISAKEITDAISNPDGKRYFIATGGSLRAASTSGKFDKNCFRVERGSDEFEVSFAAMMKDLKAHWSGTPKNATEKANDVPWGDDYFVVAERKQCIGKDAEGKMKPIKGMYWYDRIHIFKARERDPLNMGVDSISPDSVGSFGLDSYGTPSQDKQSRIKLYANIDMGGESSYEVNPRVESKKVIAAGGCP